MGEQLEYIDRERRWKREQLPDRSWKRKYAALKGRHDELLAACESLLIWTADVDSMDSEWCPLCERYTGHESVCPCAKAKAAIAKAKSDA